MGCGRAGNTNCANSFVFVGGKFYNTMSFARVRDFVEGELASGVSVVGGGPPILPGPWRKRKGAIWSAADLPGRPRKRRRKQNPSPNMPYGRRLRGGPRRRSRYVRRRYYRRRRMSYPKRIRRIALGTNESKRHTNVSTLNVDENTLSSVALARIPAKGTSDDTAMEFKNVRIGRTVFLRGIRLDLVFDNLKSDAVGVKFWVGYKKHDRSTLANDDIFKDPASEGNVDLGGFAAQISKTHAMIDTNKVRILGKRFFYLTGEEKTQTTEGAFNHSFHQSKAVKLWIPMNKYIKFEGVGVGDDSQNIDPLLWVQVFRKDGTPFGASTNIVRMDYRYITYFKDP